ncbi:hypothetical protein ACIRG5_42445 [Lentzea sp. NPDC102401]|uniref:hypothetical protein n=1 Tax=Lentzea sp. NPDC102401 TaxID=3364128 RepID=UPI0038292348
MAESATHNAPTDTPDVQRDGRYVDLVRWILWEFDTSTAIAERNNGGSRETQGRVDAYDGLLRYLQGYEGTDRDGLRARFGEQK